RAVAEFCRAARGGCRQKLASWGSVLACAYQGREEGKGTPPGTTHFWTASESLARASQWRADCLAERLSSSPGSAGQRRGTSAPDSRPPDGRVIEAGADKTRGEPRTMNVSPNPAVPRSVISAEQIQKRVREMGHQISDDYRGKTIHVLGVLENSF